MIPGAGIGAGAAKLASTAVKGTKASARAQKALKAVGKTAKGFAESEITSAGVDIADKLTIKPKKEQIVKRKTKSKNNFA